MKLSIRLKSPEGGFQRRANLQEGHESLSVQKQRVKNQTIPQVKALKETLLLSIPKILVISKQSFPKTVLLDIFFSNNEKEVVKQRDENLLG